MPRAEVGGEGEGHEGTFQEKELLCVLIVVVVTGVYLFVKI